MATWKKVLLWLMAGLLVTVGGCVALMAHLFSDMCATTVFEQTASPNGKLKAVLFQVDCGATTDFNSHVAIVEGGFDTSQSTSLSQGFFVADRDHGRAPVGVSHGPEVRIKWSSDAVVEVQYHELARVFRAEEKVRGVRIEYKVFR